VPFVGGEIHAERRTQAGGQREEMEGLGEREDWEKNLRGESREQVLEMALMALKPE